MVAAYNTIGYNMALTMAYVKSYPTIMLQAYTVTATHTTVTHTCAAHVEGLTQGF